MSNLFEIVGEGFFKPLTSSYKSVYLDCLNIIYDSYRTELSYGVDREILVQRLTYYFDELGNTKIEFEDDAEIVSDSKAKANAFLRKLIEYGWIEYETGTDLKVRAVMPSYAVTIIRTLGEIASGKETEYQSEISAIYSLLTNPDLLKHDPYPQVLKPVYDRTMDLFTALKQLNTSIKKYIEEITADKTAEEIIEKYFEYSSEIGSKAYHRLYTSNNVSRFRIVILEKLNNLRMDEDLFERIAWGIQRVEGEPDIENARDLARKYINDIIDYFTSYDDIVKEISKKHSKYLENTVKRARFLLTNTNNTEGKISTVLRYLAERYNRDEIGSLEEDASDEICFLFNVFTQNFISNESLRSVPVSRKITEVEDLFNPNQLTAEEREVLRQAAYEKNRNRFSKKNISNYVDSLLRDVSSVKASDLEINSKRDLIRIIYINLYGEIGKSGYEIVHTNDVVQLDNYRFNDFEIRRKT